MTMKLSTVDADKRFAPRRKRRLPAMIYEDGQPTGKRCVILDVSTTGARVQIDGGLAASAYGRKSDGARLRLVDLAEKVTYDCLVVRESANELGLRFAAPPLLSPQPVRRIK